MTDTKLDSLKKRLEEISDVFISQWRELHAEYPDTLWHYTDAPGFFGLLQNNELWFSDAAFLNDSSEMSYAVDLTEKIVKSRLESLEAGPTVREYLEAFTRSIINKREHLKEYGFVTPAFVSCFCEEPDSLHLWRAYTKGGHGYSIGLFPDHMINKLEPIRIGSRSVSNQSLSERWEHFLPVLCRVIYDEKKQTLIVNNLLDLLIQAINEAPEDFPLGDVNNLHRVITMSRMFTLFYLCLICFKHPTFKDEREWRLIYAPNLWKPELNIDANRVTELCYRISGDYCVPYLKIDISNEMEVDHNNQKTKVKTLEFERIIAGPGMDPRLARASFNAYALRNCYLGSNVGVEQSSVPLRSL
jgi:hypothetical protein